MRFKTGSSLGEKGTAKGLSSSKTSIYIFTGKTEKSVKKYHKGGGLSFLRHPPTSLQFFLPNVLCLLIEKNE